jgi:hypothetical protein
MRKIVDFFEHQESPIVNGIIFPNGMIQTIEISADWGPPVRYIHSKGPQISIDRFSSESDWTSCAVMKKLVDKALGFTFLAGETLGRGDDGFVAAITNADHKLKWLVFMDRSNPFCDLKVTGQYVVALSTLRCYWRFPIENPGEFFIDCDPSA